VIRLYGIPVAPADAHALDVQLHVGRIDDLKLASKIDHALELETVILETVILALSPAERDTLLGVLDDPPDGLAELLGALARDHADRQ
jgi:uncharacterized protein (DUF1778 family)